MLFIWKPATTASHLSWRVIREAASKGVFVKPATMPGNWSSAQLGNLWELMSEDWVEGAPICHWLKDVGMERKANKHQWNSVMATPTMKVMRKPSGQGEQVPRPEATTGVHQRGGGVGRGELLESAAVLCSSVLCPSDSFKSSSVSQSPVAQIPAL